MELSKLPFLSPNDYNASGSAGDEEDFAYSKDALARSSRSRQNRCLTAASRLFIVLLALWGFLSALVQISHHLKPPIDIYRPSTFPPEYNLCDCGSTIVQARSKDCKYDSMATAWLPKYCRDDELTAEFERSGPGPNGEWPYYADVNGTIPISIEEIGMLGEGERSFWALRDWHVAHCMWYWEKYVRMRDTGAVMERRFDRAKHTRHCRHLALKRDVDHDLLIEVPVVMSSRIDDLGMEGHAHGHD